MLSEQVVHVRRFNRLVTQRAGALNDEYLGRERPLGHSRVLYEIGPQGADLRELRSRLALDSGYLSRIVQSLVAAGLVELQIGPDDERIRRAVFTDAGLAEFGEMDRRSDEVAAAYLAPLSESQRTRLVGSMSEVHQLLRAAGTAIERVDPTCRAARWCLGQYYEELISRFDAGFDPARSIPAAEDEMRPPLGAFLVAGVDGEWVACGAIRTVAPGVGYIKRMWVSSTVRGLGIGRRMLAALEAEGAALGMATIQLETNRALPEAIQLYLSSGYTERTPFNNEIYAHHWFEKRLAAAPSPSAPPQP
ncbi:MAG: helix-turn-helix domain-containing GNAT family N-acetyltransferase [Gemmatimonadota bacterium]